MVQRTQRRVSKEKRGEDILSRPTKNDNVVINKPLDVHSESANHPRPLESEESDFAHAI